MPSAGKWGKSFYNAANGLQTSRSAAVFKAALVAKEAMLAVPGAPHTVAGRRTSVNVKRLSDRAAVAQWTGPAHLVDRDTQAHMIRPRAFVGTRGTGARAQRGAGLLALFGVDARSSGGLVLPDGGIRTAVQHPGTHGKHFFDKGQVAARRVVPEVYRRSMHTELAKHFTGG